MLHSLRSPTRKEFSEQSYLAWPFETCSDSAGAIDIGWVGDNVLFARFSGVVSQKLGARHLGNLKSGLARVGALHYFIDARALKSYDLLARSAFVRFLLESRRKFAAIVSLTWEEGTGSEAQTFAATVGAPFELTTNVADFERRLLRLAPFALTKVDSGLTRL